MFLSSIYPEHNIHLIGDLRFFNIMHGLVMVIPFSFRLNACYFTIQLFFASPVILVSVYTSSLFGLPSKDT